MDMSSNRASTYGIRTENKSQPLPAGFIKKLDTYHKVASKQDPSAPEIIRREQLQKHFPGADYLDHALEAVAEFTADHNDQVPEGADVSKADLKKFDTKIGPVYVRTNINPSVLHPDVFNMTKKHFDSFGQHLIRNQAVSVDFPDKAKGKYTFFRERKFDDDVKAAVKAQVEEYLKAGIIRPRHKDEPVNGRVPLNAVLRKDRKVRLIMDARDINTLAYPPQFEMPHFLSPFGLIDPKKPVYFIRLDFKDAFLHIPLAEEI